MIDEDKDKLKALLTFRESLMWAQFDMFRSGLDKIEPSLANTVNVLIEVVQQKIKLLSEVRTEDNVVYVDFDKKKSS